MEDGSKKELLKESCKCIIKCDLKFSNADRKVVHEQFKWLQDDKKNNFLKFIEYKTNYDNIKPALVMISFTNFFLMQIMLNIYSFRFIRKFYLSFSLQMFYIYWFINRCYAYSSHQRSNCPFKYFWILVRRK